MDNIQSIFNELELKRKKSRAIFIFLNVLSFLMVAGLVVLNLFAIRFNPTANHSGGVNTSEVIFLFITLSILSGLSSFVTSLISFFVFRKKAVNAKEQIEAIQHEVSLHKKVEGSYKTEDKDVLLMERITRIKNKY